MTRRWNPLFGVGLAGLIALAMLAGCQSGTSTSTPSNTTETSTTPPPPQVADSVVVLATNQGPVPRSQHLKISTGMSVAWRNEDVRGHTIRFTNWPFREPHQDILVPAGGTSPVFHMYDQENPIKFKYGIFPPVKGDPQVTPTASASGPPDPPDIVADP